MLNKNSPFGVMVDYFYRVESQQRGCPHIHGMAWIKMLHSIMLTLMRKCVNIQTNASHAVVGFFQMKENIF